MIEQQRITFTADEEDTHEHGFDDFPPVFSPLGSPEKSHEECHNPSPEKGCCFSSSTFDWGVNEDVLAECNNDFTAQQSAAAGYSKECHQLLLPPIGIEGNSNNTMLSSSHEASGVGERPQSLTMRRNYPSLYPMQQMPADVTAVPTTNNNGMSLLSCHHNHNTASQNLNFTNDGTAANMYSEMLQARADYCQQQQQQQQQQLSVCVADTAPSNANVLHHNLVAAGGPSSLGFFFDNQVEQLHLDQVQSGGVQATSQFGHEMKQDMPSFSDPSSHQQLHCGMVTSGVETITTPDVNQDMLPSNHPTRLSIPSDDDFLDPVYNFFRSACIEVFVIDNEHHSGGRGRGSRPHVIGQIGLRCVHCKHVRRGHRANQAVSYPSKTSNIFESVRNYQRFHFEACNYIPTELKEKYQDLNKQKSKKIHLKYIKVYFAEAACELGMVETANGLFFGAPPNTSGTPSEKLQAIMSIAENPSASNEKYQKMKELVFPTVDERLKNSKFSHIATETTRQVIENCRKEKTAFVYPSDFPTVSDFRFVLYHQYIPCRPPNSALNRRKSKPVKWDTLSGLCCRHCAKAYPGQKYHQGMYFPLDLESLSDSSFFNNLTCHMMTCEYIQPEIKVALSELSGLAAEHGVITKRGAKKFFLTKLWDRMANCYSVGRP